MATVSVVVPCYNYAHLLPGCLASIVNQDGVDVKVLVIDDCSPDGSGERAAELIAEMPQVELLRHQVNRGHIATYNEGLEWADGDYTVLLSADDLLVPGALRRATALMDRNPSVTFTYGYAVPFADDTSLPRVRQNDARERIWSGERWIARRCRTATNIISSPEVVVRTSTQRRVGGYRPDLPHSGDLEMWLRLAAQGDVGVITGADQAMYRVHCASMSQTAFFAALPDLAQRHAAFEAFFATAADNLPDAPALRRASARATARRALWRAGRLLRRTDRDAHLAAQDLVDFALSIAPDATNTPEYHAWRWAAGHTSLPAVSSLRVLGTALRGRAEHRAYWWMRRHRCV
jgi:GT2 family glycosyltransferase